MNRTSISIVRLAHGQGIEIPSYETEQAAGMDLRAALDEGATLVLEPGERALVPTGFIFELPVGFEAQIRPRSGLAYKNGITCLNSPGTIDSDYRGEIKVLLINHSGETFEIKRGMRVAQMIIAPVHQALITEEDTLSSTKRGDGGFGSTGSN